jgi:predicted methyltransferase
MRITWLLVLLASGCASASTPAAAPKTPESSAAEVDPSRALDAALRGPARTLEDRARDAHRHPKETLEFFGITPTMDVIELAPGGGWYTRILAPLLRDAGSLTVGLPDGKYGDNFRAMASEDPELYGQVRLARMAPPEAIELGEDGSADLVLTFRNTHGWIRDGIDEAIVAAVYRVLAPGGIFGVVQHRDAEGAELNPSTGYVPEAYVIEVAERAGFELVAKSEVNANPRDTRDHQHGVWSLPPALRVDEGERERMIEIGESDRMTLKFQKPAR